MLATNGEEKDTTKEDLEKTNNGEPGDVLFTLTGSHHSGSVKDRDLWRNQSPLFPLKNKKNY